MILNRECSSFWLLYEWIITLKIWTINKWNTHKAHPNLLVIEKANLAVRELKKWGLGTPQFAVADTGMSWLEDISLAYWRLEVYLDLSSEAQHWMKRIDKHWNNLLKGKGLATSKSYSDHNPQTAPFPILQAPDSTYHHLFWIVINNLQGLGTHLGLTRYSFRLWSGGELEVDIPSEKHCSLALMAG